MYPCLTEAWNFGMPIYPARARISNSAASYSIPAVGVRQNHLWRRPFAIVHFERITVITSAGLENCSFNASPSPLLIVSLTLDELLVVRSVCIGNFI